MYDPLEVSKVTESLVVRNNLKKYYRFRPTGFYGGIATADTVGCNLRCKFCWSGHSVWNAKETGEFFSPEKAASELQGIADKKGYHQMRISGGEPTIGKQHLLEVLKMIKSNYVFILETNGILLGHDAAYLDQLAVFPNLHVRVCLKGADAEEFSILTGAKNGFEDQMRAIQHLQKNHMSFNIALVSQNNEKKQRLFQELQAMGLGKIMMEQEEITLYPMVRKRLQDEKLLQYFE